MTTLCEPGVIYYLKESLKNSRAFKDNYTNNIYNFSMFIIFVTLVYGFLSYKYKGNITEEEKQNKFRNKRKYILNKLDFLSKIKQKSTMITDLPQWNNNNI
tara:strand:+ start:6726 stop:7028 length:303 start_codon:yes stop_codon:yes gene_type:complete